MLHLRLVVPADLSEGVIDFLRLAPEVTNLWHARGVALKPAGDLISCDMAREEATTLLDGLRRMGLEERGSIAVEDIDASVSRVALAAEAAARGAPADAVVWEEVESTVSESATLTVSFLVLITIATMIAAIGIITDSIVLIIGAMVVGPEYGPLAGICVAVVQRRRVPALRSLAALVVGFPTGIAAAALLTAALRLGAVAPDALRSSERELTLFISQPNWNSAIVAVLAGTVGMLALVSAKSGALIGVLISVTTIPAAANVGVALAYGTASEAASAAAQLGINLGAIVASGLVVLTIVRLGYRRRRERRAVA
jgi:uncharacterized hydrophobic protein (TIGR00271 family)